jgi:hypothetical protein
VKSGARADRRTAGRIILGKVLVLTYWAFALGCRGPRQNVAPAPVESAGEFSLVVNSHHLLDVNIFIVHDGQADRVATVPASSSRTLSLPSWMLGQSRLVRVIAEPIGDDTRYTSDLLSVQPGQIIELNVESSINRSNYSIQ